MNFIKKTLKYNIKCHKYCTTKQEYNSTDIEKIYEEYLESRSKLLTKIQSDGVNGVKFILEKSINKSHYQDVLKISKMAAMRNVSYHKFIEAAEMYKYIIDSHVDANQ